MPFWIFKCAIAGSLNLESCCIHSWTPVFYKTFIYCVVIRCVKSRASHSATQAGLLQQPSASRGHRTETFTYALASCPKSTAASLSHQQTKKATFCGVNSLQFNSPKTTMCRKCSQTWHMAAERTAWCSSTRPHIACHRPLSGLRKSKMH